MDSSEVANLIAPFKTVSDKIRALDGAGLPRSEIAKVLGRRYQHVRNVLEGDKLRGSSRGMGEPPASFNRSEAKERAETQPVGDHFRLVLDDQGRMELPLAVRRAWGLETGSVIMGRFQGDEFSVVTAVTSIRRAQEIVRRLIPRDVSLSDELIADRRRETAKAEAGG